MHMLSAHNRDEFLATPQMVRFEYGKGRDAFEPTLLIKGSTLLLKYVVLGAPMRLGFTMIDGKLLYAVSALDDEIEGAMLWSVVERDVEVDAIRGFSRGEPLFAFLFNEIAVNVAWNGWPNLAALPRLETWADAASLGRADYSTIAAQANAALDRLHPLAESNDEWLIIDLGTRDDWKPVRNHYVTNNASASLLDIFDINEGNQQEQIALWLTDNFQSAGAYHSPQIPKGNGSRELTDILFSHDFGSFLIESKALTILSRERLPDRSKLKRDVTGHLKKAYNQLRGAVRSLKTGVEVRDAEGNVLNVDREKFGHAIVLVPDLDLVEGGETYGIDFIEDFMKSTGAIPHILDISELLRIVQAAEMIAARSETITPIMALDYYLIERVKKAADSNSLNVRVLLRFEDE